MRASDPDEAVPGARLAVTAEALYLANLLLLPGIAFLLLAWLYVRNIGSAPVLARCHLMQTMSASVWAGLLLVAVNGCIVVFGGYRSAHTWVIVVLYFTTAHAALVMLGMVGLARAMAGRSYRYPLVGRPIADRQP